MNLRRALCTLVITVTLAGCGGDDEGEAASGSTRLVVSGASSLETAFTAYGESFGDVQFSFAGSDELAAQIRQGVPVDVFASANTSLPDDLFDEGLVEEPVVFAGNRLVLAVPTDGSDVASLEDAAKPGVTLAVGAPDVPIGSYTQEVLDKLPPAQGKAILANVRSEEPDVAGIVGKLTQGAVDAGFVYVTDVEAAGGALTAIELDEEISPAVAYGVAIVENAENAERAQEFIDGLLEGKGRAQLETAGFEPPPQ